MEIDLEQQQYGGADLNCEYHTRIMECEGNRYGHVLDDKSRLCHSTTD
jgi:hypothetical protein